MKDNEKTYRIGEKIILEDDLTLQYAGTDEKKTYKKRVYLICYEGIY